MAQAPRFRIPPHLVVLRHSPDVVELRSGVWNTTSHVIRDEGASGHLGPIVGLLDGTRPVAEIAAATGASRETVEGVVDHLLAQGLVDEDPRPALTRVADLLGGPPPAIVPHAVVTLGDGLSDRLAALLRESDGTIDVAADPTLATRVDELARDDSWLGDGLEESRALAPFARWADRLVVVAEELVDPLRSRVVNRATLAHHMPCLHVALDGPFVLVGPLVVPRRSACWECFEARVVMNLRDSAIYVRYKEALAQGQITGANASLAAVAGLGASLGAVELLSFLATGEASSIDHVWSIFLPTMEVALHEVLRMPGCPGCGAVAERDDSDLYFDLRALAGP